MAERVWTRGVVAGLFVLHLGAGGCTVDENKYKFGTAGESSATGGEPNGDDTGKGGRGGQGGSDASSGNGSTVAGSGGSGATGSGATGSASGGGTSTPGGSSGTGEGGNDSGGDGTGATAGAGGDTTGTGGTDPGITCPTGQHVCADKCVSDDDVSTCGTSCTPCETPTDGMATCDGTKCGLECPSGKKPCAGGCIATGAACNDVCEAGTHACNGLCPSTQSVNACGTSCTPCPVPTGAAQATCDGTSCSFQCSPGYHRCDEKCSADDDAKNCGAACAVCPTSANGSAVCLAGSCSIQCKSGYHLCGGTCVSDTSPLTCGSSCDPCEVPTGGSAACTAGKCVPSCPSGQSLCNSKCIPTDQVCAGVPCPTGKHACNNLCVADTSTTACGDSCMQCTRPTGASDVTCSAGTCDFACGSGYHRCGSACSTDDDVNACGSDCKKCATTANGAPICQTGGTCGIKCNTDYHLCGTKCVDNASITQCGPSCAACTAPTGGSVTCNGTACVPACPSGQKVCNGACVASNAACGEPCTGTTHNCNGFCVSNTDVATCGTRCSACPAPPSHGSPVCTNSACDISCSNGYHKCDSTCLDNTSINSCGSSCSPCTPPTHATAKCVNGACGFDCVSGYVGANCEFPVFQAVPLPTGYARTYVRDISADGSVVAGNLDNDSYTRGFRWVVASAAVTPFPAGTATPVGGISADGVYISGDYYDDAGSATPARWNASFTRVGFAPVPVDTYVDVQDISGDGTTVVGTQGGAGLIWKVGTSTETLITDPAYTWILFHAMSGNAKTAVGSASGTAGWVPVVWTSAGGLVQLSGGADADAMGVSRDGTVIVGYVGGDASVPTRWTGTNFATRQPLATLPTTGTVPYGRLNATNLDGTVSVGYSYTADNMPEAAIWNATTVRKISDIVIANGGNLAGWNLFWAIAVSDDGKVIVGEGNLNGLQRSWIVHLP